MGDESGPAVIIRGRYRVLATLAAGDPETLLAQDEALGRQVVLKHARAGERVRQLRREAVIVAGIRHAHVVVLHDWWHEAGHGYAVFEHVAGATLADALRAGARPPRSRVLAIARQLLAALGAVHARGMVHADIKPGNVLLRPDGAAVLADFGIAGYIGERPEAAPGMTVGTVAYMSPEQARGEALGPASDLYSLGAVMYELLVGRPPHVGATPADVARLQVTAEPIAPRLLDPTVPPAVDRLVVRALSKRPEARWPSASAMLVDVEQCEAAADDVTRTLVAVGDRGADKPDAGWSRGRPAVWVAAGALCLAAAIAFAAFVRPIASASAGPRATPTSQARPSATPSTFEQIIIGGISSPTPTPTGSASPTGPTATPTSVPARTPGPDPRIVPVPTRPTWETPVASTFTVAIPPQGTSRHLINASLRSDEAVRARITVTGGKRDVQLTVLAGDGSVIVEPVVVSDDETFVWPVRRRAPWTLVIDNNSSLLIGKIVTVSYEVIRLD